MEIHALYAALLGGGLIGTGMLVIFRHKMSLGGFNILALFFTRTFWNSCRQGSDGTRLHDCCAFTVHR
ncbi:YitT family protein [Vibrio cyclitrophicus]|uniref:YitT family protein n=1 Tax=Vibrio cyclitrophicus TaxID=47951 RepID=UPI0038B2D10E